MFRILAIDDDPSVLDVYQKLYRKSNEDSLNELLGLDKSQEKVVPASAPDFEGRLDVVNSGQAGYEWVKAAVEEDDPYAVIYLDMRMPGGWDGIETAREIRSVDMDVRIIMITAFSDQVVDNVQEIIGNAFVYLKKPFIREELLQLTRFLCEDWQRARELRLALLESQASNVAKSEFLAMMSHELRTPLTALLGNGQILAESALNGDQRTLLQNMENSGKGLLNLVNDILDASLISAGDLEISTHPFDLSGLINRLQQRFEERAELAALEFLVESPPALQHKLIGDEKRLEQIVSNLLGNAFKFTRQGRVTLRVTQPLEGEFHFEVEDTGVGIRKDRLEGLFEQFKQGDQSVTRSHGGMGLGLHISRQLAHMMEGQIAAQSEPDQGSKFVLQLPLQQGPALLLPREGANSGERLQGKVLVVDDARELQLLLKVMLESMGLTVTVAGDGLEGLKRAIAEEFDLILMDIRMPVMDGISSTREIRAHGVSTPIIMLTAEVMEQQREEARQAGAYAVFSKPITKVTLQQIVTLYCGMVGDV